MNKLIDLFVLGPTTRIAVPLLLGAALLLSGCSTTPPAAANTANAAPKAAEDHSGHTVTTGTGELKVPAALAAEHEEIHEQLAEAIKSGGKTGEAAKLVEERLGAHFKGEEEYALPQLGLLVPLSEGKSPADAKRAIELSDKLKAELPKMLEAHKGIVDALDKLIAVAREENKTQPVEFAETLKAHAQSEEQITYPAAILVGEYLKLKK